MLMYVLLDERVDLAYGSHYLYCDIGRATMPEAIADVFWNIVKATEVIMQEGELFDQLEIPSRWQEVLDMTATNWNVRRDDRPPILAEDDRPMSFVRRRLKCVALISA